MKQGIFTIQENLQIAPDMYEMALTGDVCEITRPGQFVNIALDGFYLRRPLSVHDVDPAQESCGSSIKRWGGERTPCPAWGLERP